MSKYEQYLWKDGNLYGFTKGQWEIVYDRQRARRAMQKIPEFMVGDSPLRLPK